MSRSPDIDLGWGLAKCLSFQQGPDFLGRLPGSRSIPHGPRSSEPPRCKSCSTMGADSASAACYCVNTGKSPSCASFTYLCKLQSNNKTECQIPARFTSRSADTQWVHLAQRLRVPARRPTARALIQLCHFYQLRDPRQAARSVPPRSCP